MKKILKKSLLLFTAILMLMCILPLPILALNPKADGTFITNGNGNIAGDYDCNGEVNVQDAILTLRAAMNLITPSGQAFKNADVNFDGKLTVQDAILILRMAMGLIEPPMPPVSAGYYFETDPALEGWTWEDRDGDGENWQWIYKQQEYIVPEGSGCMASFSFDRDSLEPLTPDNWLISPDVPGGGSVSFQFVAQDKNYPSEPIGVYASADGGYTWRELAYFVSSGSIQIKTVSLSQYAGRNIKLAFRHYDVTEQFCVNFDAVEIRPDSMPVVFHDANFEAAFRSKYNITGTITLDMILSYTELDLNSSNPKLQDITDAAMFINLTGLDIHGNQISNLNPLSGLKKLTKLDLSSNKIADVKPLSGLTNLTDLNLHAQYYKSGNEWIYTLNNINSLSGLVNLTKLGLGSNQISDISTLSGFTKLTNLNLCSNRISDISALSGLTKLTGLDLQYNNLTASTDVSPLYKLTKLKLLSIKTGNSLTQTQINAIQSHLPNCTIN